MNWPAAAVLLAVGVPAGVAANRIADEVARRRPDARRRTRLPGRGPLVLVATPLLFAGCGLAFDLPRAVVAAFYCFVLVTVSSVDAEQRIVPNRIVVPATVIILAAQSAIEPSVEWIAASAAGGGFFFVAALAYPAGMGMGDVKLALVLGAMLGWPVAVAIAVALLSSLVPSIAILIRHGRGGRKMGIPFAPFLALGGVVALFAGRGLLDAYLDTLG